MPLGRAFTKRLGRSDSNATDGPLRSFSTRKGGLRTDDISLPVSLISTTNPLSYEAPDIKGAPLAIKIPSTMPDIGRNPRLAPKLSMSTSDNDTPTPSTGTEPGLTDGSSAESSPYGSPHNSSPILEENHLSCYFPGPTLKRSPSAKSSTDLTVPALPQRAVSHSKKEHERLARKRSSQNSRPTSRTTSPSPPESLSNKDATRSSAEILGLNSPTASLYPPKTPIHPFSQELEKLDEVVEGYHGYANSIDTAHDEEFMKTRNLTKFSAVDYILEIGDPYAPLPPDLGGMI